MFQCTITNDPSTLRGEKISDKEFERNMYVNLQSILNGAFVESAEKRRIKTTSKGFVIACPYCGDSATDPRKKRGNMMLSGKYAGWYKCFNCGKMSKIQNFLRDFNKEMTMSELSYIKNYTFDASTYSKIATKMSADVLDATTAYNWAVPREDLKNAFGLKEIDPITSPFAYNYLVGRCQTMRHDRFLYSEKTHQILILNLIKDRVLGLQIRNLNPKAKVKYLTMTLDKIRASICKDTSPIPETVTQLSCVFNIFDVDFSNVNYRPVLVTEGPFDAFLLPNCIAISGASKNFIMQFPFWYIYDGDDTGRAHAFDMLKKGYKVFMWKKFIADYGLPDRKKWDVSDVLVYMRDNKVNKQLLWSPYFTNSTLDGLNV